MTDWPQIRPAGITGFLVSFGDTLSEPANRAALAFLAALDADTPAGVEEASTSLVSTFVRIDPVAVEPRAVRAALAARLASRDWYAAALPGGRRLWRIPAVFGTDLAPQLAEAAAVAGMDVDAAVRSVCDTTLRVQTIGFAPGQPYLGALPEAWNIPRQTVLTDKVTPGAVTVAIRQITMFSVAAPTGWRHIGQAALRLFDPSSESPFVLRPGDAVRYQAVERAAFDRLRAAPLGGAVSEAAA